MSRSRCLHMGLIDRRIQPRPGHTGCRRTDRSCATCLVYAGMD
jgi:hypothetical protein